MNLGLHESPADQRPDVAQLRLDNALALFDEFVRHATKHPDAATLRGLERRFAEQLNIQPSYWSQIKSRSRQIGERLARQFELHCRKPHGWLDQDHASQSLTTKVISAYPSVTLSTSEESSLPQTADERFIVGLVLSYYRRHPERARNRLLDILGEVLNPANPPTLTAARTSSKLSPTQGTSRTLQSEDEHALWRQSQRAVAPLKRKR
jgi:hypothetical protein